MSDDSEAKKIIIDEDWKTQVERERVMLMPQGTDPDELAEKSGWLEAYCLRNGLRFCPRKQIEWFGMARGT